jgi:hypothetical protein
VRIDVALAAHDDRLELVFTPGGHISGSKGNGFDEGPPVGASDVEEVTDGLEIVRSCLLPRAVVPLGWSCWHASLPLQDGPINQDSILIFSAIRVKGK